MQRVCEGTGRASEKGVEVGRYVLGPVGRFVGAVGGLMGCEADAVVALDLGRRGRLAGSWW